MYYLGVNYSVNRTVTVLAKNGEKFLRIFFLGNHGTHAKTKKWTLMTQIDR